MALIRPSKRSRLVPAFGLDAQRAGGERRVQRGLEVLLLVLATHLPETRRPAAACRNVSVVRVVWLLVKLKVVPIGSPFRLGARAEGR